MKVLRYTSYCGTTRGQRASLSRRRRSLCSADISISWRSSHCERFFATYDQLNGDGAAACGHLNYIRTGWVTARRLEGREFKAAACSLSSKGPINGSVEPAGLSRVAAHPKSCRHIHRTERGQNAECRFESAPTVEIASRRPTSGPLAARMRSSSSPFAAASATGARGAAS